MKKMRIDLTGFAEFGHENAEYFSRGHQLFDGVESAIGKVLPGARVITHLEPLQVPNLVP